MFAPTLLNGLLLLLLFSLPILPIWAEMRRTRAVFKEVELKALPSQHCAVCGIGQAGHSHGNQAISGQTSGPAMAHLDPLAHSDPAAWLRERLVEHTPSSDPINIPAYLKLAYYADLFLNQLKADPMERQLLLPEAAESNLGRFSTRSRAVGRLNIKAQAGETKPHLSWLMPGDADPYLITLEPRSPSQHTWI